MENISTNTSHQVVAQAREAHQNLAKFDRLGIRNSYFTIYGNNRFDYILGFKS